LLTDLVNDQSRTFFQKHGFQRSEMIPMRLYLGTSAELRKGA
jgi:hypothetical protein